MSDLSDIEQLEWLISEIEDIDFDSIEKSQINLIYTNWNLLIAKSLGEAPENAEPYYISEDSGEGLIGSAIESTLLATSWRTPYDEYGRFTQGNLPNRLGSLDEVSKLQDGWETVSLKLNSLDEDNTQWVSTAREINNQTNELVVISGRGLHEITSRVVLLLRIQHWINNKTVTT